MVSAVWNYVIFVSLNLKDTNWEEMSTIKFKYVTHVI